MRSPSEMDALSEMFFFLFNTLPGCLLYLQQVGLQIWLIDLYVFQCNLKPKFNCENKDYKKFKVVLRRLFQISKFIFSTLTRKNAFSRYSTMIPPTYYSLQYSASLVNLLKKMQKYKIIV